MMLSRYWRRRLLRHGLLVVLALASGIVVASFFAARPVRFRVSMATAYVSLAYLGASLAIGPLNVLRRRPNPVSADVRRDIGIWAAIIAIVHIAAGLTVHMRGRIAAYFLQPRPEGYGWPRVDAFGAANWSGLLAGGILLLLLLVSSDAALRRLGTNRWKTVQRWNYAAALSTVAHGATYQLIEKRPAPWVVCFTAIAVATSAIQLAGFIAFRLRRSSRSRAPQPAPPPA